MKSTLGSEICVLHKHRDWHAKMPMKQLALSSLHKKGRRLQDRRRWRPTCALSRLRWRTTGTPDVSAEILSDCKRCAYFSVTRVHTHPRHGSLLMARVVVKEWLERRSRQRTPDGDLGAVNFAITTYVQDVKKTAGGWTIVTKGETIRLRKSALCHSAKSYLQHKRGFIAHYSGTIGGRCRTGGVLTVEVAMLNQLVGNVGFTFMFRYIIWP